MGEAFLGLLGDVDEKAAELLFRQKVIRLLHDQELLSQDKLDLLDSWKAGHTGSRALI